MNGDNFEKDAEAFLTDYGASVLIANKNPEFTSKWLYAFQELHRTGIRQLKGLLALYEVEIKSSKLEA